MSRKKTLSRNRKLALLVGTAVLTGGAAVVLTGTGQASAACDGLATALRNNEQFIAGQRARPDARSEARIANRLAVVEEIRRKQAAAGCDTGGAQAGGTQEGGAEASGGPVAVGRSGGTGADAGTGAGTDAGDSGGQQPPARGGEVVCAGSTVTLSGEAGAPAASSDRFPAGTRLKVTNLDNGRSTTVEVTSPSGSCVLLNAAAFEQVREPGKFLIREARVERVG
ncbi:septal ring lytic transglycosylase RlpA family protein [Streptomyces sp. DH12]|uniref:septal ring lytic transglycosylase RlpA family protein n=1 Tax=Streptomyces sp. DH12 TaxID=2857010 RepID=UPI001E4F9AB4|nr:septal ring lytic transglycosylase RlpA family protein [Streptomyces sp. DH12]